MVKVTEEAFSSQKRPSNTSKHEIFFIFSNFVGHFSPPGSGSGSTDPIESGSNWDPDPQLCAVHNQIKEFHSGRISTCSIVVRRGRRDYRRKRDHKCRKSWIWTKIIQSLDNVFKLPSLSTWEEFILYRVRWEWPPPQEKGFAIWGFATRQQDQALSQ